MSARLLQSANGFGHDAKNESDSIFPMSNKPHNTRILALDLRLQRFGYAILEGDKSLLAWGIRTYRDPQPDGRAQLARKRIAPLLSTFQPALIVANHVSELHACRGQEHYRIVRVIEEEGRQQSASLMLLGRGEIRKAFGRLNQTTKEGIAAHVALAFPELKWKLPPIRKTWMSEHHNMPIFDATALGLTYFARVQNDLSASSPRSR